MTTPGIRFFLPTLLVVSLAQAACGKGAQETPSGKSTVTPPPASGEAGALLRQGLKFLSDAQTELAVRALEEAHRRDPASPAIATALGRAYREDDRYAAARRILEELLDSSSIRVRERVEARQALVEVLLGQGELAEARRHCDLLLEGRPASSVSRRLSGIVAYREGDLGRSVSDLREAVRLDPDDATAQSALGLAELQTGNLPGAARALEASVRLDPDSPEALSNLAKVYARQGREGEAESTRARFRKVYDRKSVRQKLGPLRARGVEAFNEGQLEAARKIFQEILDLSPRDPQALAQMGSVLMAMTRLDEAEGFLRRSLEVRPDYDFAWTELGRVQALRNDLAGAIRMFERAIQANPDAPEPHYFLAGIYYAQRRKEDFLRERSAFERLKRSAAAGSSMMVLPDEESR